MSGHEIDDFAQRRIRRDREDLPRHDVGDLVPMLARIAFCRFAWFDKKLEPSRAGTSGSDLDPAQKVTLGYDADKRAACIEDGQPADPVPDHDVRRMLDARVGLHGHDADRHNVTGLHGSLSIQAIAFAPHVPLKGLSGH
jgi:hypothetical protein